MEVEVLERTIADRKKESNEKLPWIEKYRPSSLSDIISNQDIISTITRLLDSNKLPNLLLYGPPV